MYDESLYDTVIFKGLLFYYKPNKIFTTTILFIQHLIANVYLFLIINKSSIIQFLISEQFY